MHAYILACLWRALFLTRCVLFGQIDSSLSKVRHKKEAIVCSPAVQTINTKVVKPVQQGVQARVIEPSKAFLSSANGVFRHLQQRAVASGTAAKVSAEDFMAGE